MMQAENYIPCRIEAESLLSHLGLKLVNELARRVNMAYLH